MSLKDVMVYIKDVTKKYGDTSVLKGFSLEILKGEIMCLLGANGSGKSTLVNILSGLTSMDDGDILMNIDDR
jgi:ABC-type multidrug transport system ATPase subunit